MADDPSKRGTQDRNRISLSEAYEVRCWTKKIRCHTRRSERGRQEGRQLGGGGRERIGRPVMVPKIERGKYNGQRVDEPTE